MINILKLRKLEKETKLKQSTEDKNNVKEIQEASPVKEISAEQQIVISQEIPLLQEQVKEVLDKTEISNPDENPVETFRQNLLNELLKSDTLPEYSNIEQPSKVSANKEPNEKILEYKPDEFASAQNIADQAKKNHEEVLHLVSFSLGKENYGVDIMSIREIIRMVDITKVPRAPEFIEGVINLRGSVIPVINLRTRIKLEKKEYDKSTRILVIELKDKVIGFIVDEVKEVLRISESVLTPPPLITVGKNVEYITAVAKLESYLIILVDPEKLLSSTELEKIRN